MKQSSYPLWVNMLAGFLILLGVSTHSFSQPTVKNRAIPLDQRPEIASLKGTLVDKTTTEPLIYASVVLKLQSDSTLVSGSITNEKGEFEMKKLPPGLFLLTINFVGYPPQNIDSIFINRRMPDIDLGLVEVEPIAELLDEVTVEAARTLMETGLDKRVFNVAQEITATGGTGLQIMENIPSVAVDFDGNISLRGSENVTILIDGRPSTLTGLSGSEALEQIPAEMIDRVEVITNPSARYDPSGNSGIINVVLKKQSRPGYNGMVSLNANSLFEYNGSANFNFKVNKWNFFATYGGRFRNNEWFGNSLRTINPQTISPNYMDQQLNGSFGMTGHNASVGLDYNFSEKSILTLSSRFNNWERQFDYLSEYMLFADLTDPNEIFTMNNNSEMIHHSFSHQMNYKKEFAGKNHELITDLTFSTMTMDRNENFLQTYFEQDFGETNGSSFPERSYMDGGNWLVATQLDYTRPLNEKSKLEAGYRVQLREMDSDFIFEDFFQENQLWDVVSNRSNHFIYSEQIYAAYLQYATMIGKFSLQTGLRAEQSFVKGDLLEQSEKFTQDYLNLFPTLHLRRDFENNQAFQISYSRRIQRPHNRTLNPFTRYKSEYDISRGNPELDPELIDSYEMGYTKYWEKTTLNPSVFYRSTNGMITRLRGITQVEDRNVTLTTYENLNRGISYGTELILNQEIASWWKINSTLSYFRNIIIGKGAEIDEENDNYSWSARLVSNINLNKDWNIQVNGFYRSPIVMLQGEMDAMYAVSAGLRKNILKNRGTISLNVNDIFNTMRFGMYNYGDSFTLTSERWRTSRYINIGFSFRINQYKRQQNGKRERSDDGQQDMMDFDDI